MIVDREQNTVAVSVACHIVFRCMASQNPPCSRRAYILLQGLLPCRHRVLQYAESPHYSLAQSCSSRFYKAAALSPSKYTQKLSCTQFTLDEQEDALLKMKTQSYI